MVKARFTKKSANLRSKLHLCTALTLALSSWQMASAQQQQSSPSSLDEVVVTGSHIAREVKDSLEPTISVSGELIKERGYNNVADALASIPGLTFAGGATSSGPQNGYSVGQSFVNMFGLGSQRTLVLVDGHRFTPGQTPSLFSNDNPGLQVDLNTIPTELIDHIEVVSVGGSSTYGADAVAGTINIIMKDNFEGVTGDFQFGRSPHGDGNTYSLKTAMGANTDDKRGNATFSFEFNQQDGLLASQRAFGRADYNYSANPAPGAGANNIPGTVLIKGNRSPTFTVGGVLYNANQDPTTNGMLMIPNPSNPGQLVPAQFARGGNIVPYNPGTVFPDLTAQGGQGYDGAYSGELQTNTRRYNATLSTHYDIDDSMRAYANLYYSHNDATTVNSAAQTDFNIANYFGNQQVGPVEITVDGPNANPFLNAQAKAILASSAVQSQLITNPDGSHGFYLSRSYDDFPYSARATSVSQDLFDVVFGLKGGFNLLSRDITYDVSFIAGGNYNSVNSPQFLQQNFNNAVNAVADPTTGQPVCQIPGSGCAPLNLFGQGAPSAAAANYILATDVNHTILQQDVADANFTIPVVDLPGGKMTVATGFEYRREYGAFAPGPVEAQGLGRFTPITGVSGGYNSAEGYFEGLVPLVSSEMNWMGVHSLQVEGSFRRIDNSIEGFDNAWTAGGRYAPTGDIQFRGNVSRSIRAPAVTELYLPSATFFNGFNSDICDNASVNSGPNPVARAANCASALKALGFNTANPFFSNSDSSSIPGVLSGSPHLRNEQANSWSVGATFTPSFIPRLSASLDWVNIHINNVIQDLSATQIMSECYDSPNYPNVPACSFIKRYSAATAPSPALIGGLISLNSGFQNTAGYLTYQGLQSQINYDFDVNMLPLGVTQDLGKVTLNTIVNYTGSALQSISGTAFDLNKLTDTPGQPRFSGQLNMTYAYDRYKLLWQALYTGSMAFNNSFTMNTQNILRVGSYWQHNATVLADLTDQVQVRFICNNVFDTLPPNGVLLTSLGNAAAGGAGSYDFIGRYFEVGGRVTF